MQLKFVLRAIACGLIAFAPLAATAQGTLRIATTAGDIPPATGMPDKGFEGMRFLGYPIFEGLILWDMSRRSPDSRATPPYIWKSEGL